jgi:hypothetical protein
VQPVIARAIALGVMGCTVGFDDQFVRQAGVVDDERSDLDLPSEVQSQ